jgi:type II secretory pathway pseudopilin PulG
MSRVRVRAFTLIEAVVTLAAMGLLVAFALPQLTNVGTMSGEQHAKLTLNAVADSVVAAYARTVVSAEWNTEVVPALPPGPNVDPQRVRLLAPDVRVTDSPTEVGQESNQASVGSRLYQPTAGSSPWWRVGAAVLVSNTSGAGSCWLMWRNLDPPAGVPLENYMVFDASDGDEGGYCTGQAAVGLEFIAPSADSPPATGKSWSTPRQVTKTEMVSAIANG